MRDLRLRYKGNRIIFRYLKWDTSFFGIKSFLVDTSSLIIKPDSKIFLKDALDSLGRSFITVKVPSGAPRYLIDMLFDLNFKYINTDIMLRFDGSSVTSWLPSGFPSNLWIEKAKGVPRDAHLLGTEFDVSRFHLDKNIGRRRSDRLWTEYVRNFRVGANKHLFTARMRDETVGGIFVEQYRKRRERVSNLFFVAVKKEYKGRNIGTALIRYTLNWCVGRSDVITVGTQANNIASLNFYIKNGFSKILETKIILHRWSR